MSSPGDLPRDDVVDDILNEAGQVDDAKVADALGVNQDDDKFKTLKYSLLGPSLTKAGQDSVDQTKVSEIIYNASKGSKFFNREEERDKVLTQKIEGILRRKKELDKLDLSHERLSADRLIAELEASRDLTQHIIHIDCDAFYAAVEQLDRPELKDLPFAVGGGVLTTCNYLARRFGCRSGMAGFVAKKLCPQLVLVKPDFTKYTTKGREVREVLADYDARFESASLDEAYLNITEYCAAHDMGPAEVVERLRREVHEKTGITVSAGIAANSRLAKICSNLNKPNGQYVLPRERGEIVTFMRGLPTRKVPGIGRVLERELLEVGIKTCGDIFEHRQYLHRLFGTKTFEFLVGCYLGLGRTRIRPAEEYERKSVGTESTFREMADPAMLREKLRATAEELEGDMRRAGCKGRTLCLKVKLHTFEVYTRQVVTPRAVCLADDLYNLSLPMLAKLEQEMPRMRLRLMGLRCTHLVSTKKPDTMAFFGFKAKRPGDEEASLSDEAAVEPGFENCSEEEDVSRVDGEGDDDEGRDHAAQRRHGKEIVPNPKKQQPAQPEEWWDCPICMRPQAADERQFNEHIDLCLSRQTIREAVQADGGGSGNGSGSDYAAGGGPSKRPQGPPERKRASSSKASNSDPRQKKLCFG
ncbi:DNA-directed polymerase kappa [Cordyceps fumosorosea ARSEF 2679]|uniref:DNA polymerase kappa n=1 Tax=Cordyceps fumosorosea (strain ARSEF 2679) TaxID=1081104 RepID=A0A167NYT7_CORFA|nr:DNA-directed polymerase kappa [Cordyceps fumosorosea ARSEF 2679]OAA56094.1 DNA-directed polymerase kappa [Cordyceps fumosorosea ARSEF 2679]